jgi:hypothetical protein
MAFIGLARIRTKPRVKLKEKKCSGKCNDVKDIELFNRDPLAPDGRRRQCIKCESDKRKVARDAKRAEREAWAMI